MSQELERFEPDTELQALLDSMKEYFEWEAKQLKGGSNEPHNIKPV